MKKDKKSNELLIPVYINEKIVLDMLAIIEDGFSVVSQVSYSEHSEGNASQKANAAASLSTLFGKLLRIDFSGEISHSTSSGTNAETVKEKVHTNVSLLSKFRQHLVDNGLLSTEFKVAQMQVGDFIEVEGELQKNPLVNCLETILDLNRIADFFSEKPELGCKTQANNKRKQKDKDVDKLESLVDELKHSGTIDFLLCNSDKRVVLSAQEKYLANDNISEIIGGRFKVLGKVVSICKDESEEIDLCRKTFLSVLPERILDDLVSTLNGEEVKDLKLPELIMKITGPAIMVIPIAIYV